MLRLVLYIILIYLIIHLAKKVIAFLKPGPGDVKGQPKNKIRSFDPANIEDIDFKEVDKKNGS